jgi:peptide/nickel transport system permease protein
MKKLLRAFGVVWGVVTLLFLLFSLLGDPAAALAGQRADEATLAAIRHDLGLDLPLWQQYLLYLNDLSPLGVAPADAATGEVPSAWGFLPISGNRWLGLKLPNLRRSFVSGQPVAQLYAQRIGATALLAGGSLLVAAVLGIGLGTLAGVHTGSKLDKALTLVSLLGISVPSFLAGVLLLWLFALGGAGQWALPPGGYVAQPTLFGNGSTWEWSRLVLPLITLGIRPLAILFQLTRDTVRDVMREDYIRTARAKGLPPAKVVLRHALRNALNPVVTSLTGWLASLLAGAFFVEYIFNWPGIGQLTLDALMQNDHPVLLGCTLATALVFVALSYLLDYVYAWLDPRVSP